MVLYQTYMKKYLHVSYTLVKSQLKRKIYKTWLSLIKTNAKKMLQCFVFILFAPTSLGLL